MKVCQFTRVSLFRRHINNQMSKQIRLLCNKLILQIVLHIHVLIYMYSILSACLYMQNVLFHQIRGRDFSFLCVCVILSHVLTEAFPNEGDSTSCFYN